MAHEEGESFLPDSDGIDRRKFLSCMAWVGTGLLWTIDGGVPSSSRLGAEPPKGKLFFMQISDSHIGFDKAANTDVTATLRAAVSKINALDVKPAFVLHTGDITQLAKPSEFDTADQVLRDIRTERTFFVPGEHDVGADTGASYLERYGKGTQKTRDGGGWYSFDHSGVHFIGLVNVLNLKAGGLGSLGPEQLAWLERDVKHLPSSTPIVVFAHVPLWSVYPAWGWGTDDGARALGYMKRFGSVTVLNGHIHQTMQKVEGNVAFHTALSTAFPQPRPGHRAVAGSHGGSRWTAERRARRARSSLSTRHIVSSRSSITRFPEIPRRLRSRPAKRAARACRIHGAGAAGVPTGTRTK